MIEPIF